MKGLKIIEPPEVSWKKVIPFVGGVVMGKK